MTLSRLILFTALIMLTPLTAKAEQSCEKPIEQDDLYIPVPGYCNVYDRQLAYREERIEFRKKIEERRKEFIKPQVEAEADYARKWEALNARRNHDDDITSQ